jgi:hypothetical protein
MPSPSLVRTRSPDELPQPVRLSDEAMSAVLAASHPLPPASRSDFLAAVARELAGLPEIGDGIVHRVVMVVQQKFFDPPPDARASWELKDRVTKLTQAPAIAEDIDKRFRSSRARM